MSRRIGKDVDVPQGDGALMNRRKYLKTAAAGAAGVAALSMPTIAKAQNKTWKLKMQSNWTGIGIQSQDRSAEMFVERVNKLSGGRIEITNFDAGVLLGIGETFRGVSAGVADLAVTAPVYHRGIVPVGEYLWSVPFLPSRISSSTRTFTSSWASRNCGRPPTRRITSSV